MALEPDRVVYKICSRDAWAAALEHGVLQRSPDDERDGYMHLSAAHQVRGSLLKHFPAQAGLVPGKVQPVAVGLPIVTVTATRAA